MTPQEREAIRLSKIATEKELEARRAREAANAAYDQSHGAK